MDKPTKLDQELAIWYHFINTIDQEGVYDLMDMFYNGEDYV